MTQSIVIYSKSYCPYCKAAKTLLTQKGVAFTEYEISENPALTAEMIQRSNGGRTVPQIFIGDVHVGGGTDLLELNRTGGLDALLKPFLASA
ncbi:MAG: glutaredoxin 3 [Litorimonas sp.]